MVSLKDFPDHVISGSVIVCSSRGTEKGNFCSVFPGDFCNFRIISGYHDLIKDAGTLGCFYGIA